MSIQSDINQTIGMASALLSINPSVQEAAKKRSELNDINRQVKKSEKTREVLAERADTLAGELGETSQALSKKLNRVNSDLSKGKTVSKKRMMQLENDYSNFLNKDKEVGLMNDDITSLHKNEVDNASRAFDIDPTPSRYDKYSQARLASKEWDEKMGALANMRAAGLQATEIRMKAVRDKFMRRYAPTQGEGK